MKQLLTLFSALTSAAIMAQCPFDATVQPNAPILCPNESVVLSTQSYDSYQWYKDGSPVPGANAQTLLVTAANDAGSMFAVEVTLDSCTEMSTSVLVDGWVFLLPYVIHGGDEANYYDDQGTPHFCNGDTVILTFSYTENVQWTNNGVPIPGATNDTLIVTDDGNYSASGAPSICPDFIMGLGVSIPQVFDEPVQPVITLVDDQLCVSPEGDTYQWYMNGAPMLGNASCIPALEGSYTVFVDYGTDCSVMSEPYVVTSIGDPTPAPRPIVYPSPARDRVTITWRNGGSIGAWRMHDATGRVVLSGRSNNTELQLDLGPIGTGRYWISAEGHRPVAVTVVK